MPDGCGLTVGEGKQENFLDGLLTHFLTKARLVESLVEKLRELPYPTRTPRHLAKIIGGITEGLRRSMWQRAAQARPDDKHCLRALKFAVKIIERLAAYLRFVERATTRQTPWSLILPLEQLSEKLHHNCRFLIRPQWNYNFTILDLHSEYSGLFNHLPRYEALRQILASVSGELAGFYVVGFPYLERDSVLRHVLFGHEVGHPIEKEFFKAHSDPTVPQKIKEDVSREMSNPPTGADYAELLNLRKEADLAEAASWIRLRALAELICDMVCVRLFGPAALFALFEYCRPYTLDGDRAARPEAHYPPWRYRLRMVSGMISDEWFGDFLTKGEFESATQDRLWDHLRHIREVVASREDLDELEGRPATRIAYKYVKESLPQAEAFVKNRLKDYPMDALIGSTHALLLRQLEHWLPPDHYIDAKSQEVPANFFTILNVGWIRFITGFPSLGAKVPEEEQSAYLDQLHSLNMLLLKAVENSMVRTAWQKKPSAD